MLIYRMLCVISANDAQTTVQADDAGGTSQSSTTTTQSSTTTTTTTSTTTSTSSHWRGFNIIIRFLASHCDDHEVAQQHARQPQYGRVLLGMKCLQCHIFASSCLLVVYCCPATTSVQTAAYDPIDDVYAPVESLDDLPWFNNTSGEISSELANAQLLTSVINWAVVDDWITLVYLFYFCRLHLDVSFFSRRYTTLI